MRRRAALSVAVLALACTSVEERQADERRFLDQTLSALGGGTIEVPLVEVDDGAIDARVRELLAHELDVENAIRVALLNSRSVRASYERLGLSAADFVQAGLLRNPVLDADVVFFEGGHVVDFGISKSLFDVFFVRRRAALAEDELEATRASALRDLVHLVHEVRRALVRVRAAENLVELRTRQLESETAAHELTLALHAAGSTTDIALTIEELGMDHARVELATARSAALEAREPVNVLLGLWGDSVGWKSAALSTPLVSKDFAFEGLETSAIGSSLDLAENRALANRAARNAGIEHWESLFGEAAIGVMGMREQDGERGFGPSIVLDLPVFDFGTAKEASSRAALRLALDRHVALAVEIRAATRVLRERVRSLAERTEYLRAHHLPLRHRFVVETLREYNAMQVGAFNVLAARQTEIETEIELLETEREAQIARIDLDELLAGSLARGRVDTRIAMGKSGARESTRNGH